VHLSDTVEALIIDQLRFSLCGEKSKNYEEFLLVSPKIAHSKGSKSSEATVHAPGHPSSMATIVADG
jgi:hypothetical protein